MTDRHDSVEACAQRIVERCGPRLAIAAPLGLGKPNALLNALYRRAEADPAISLQLYTALSLARPSAKSDLERRFLEPFVQRHFGRDYPDLAYLEAARAGRLPANVRVSEFYLQSGAMLGVAPIQRAYASINYTHVARELAAAGVNAIVQLVAKRVEPGGARYSLSCNPDVTLDLLDRIAAAGGPRPLVVGQVHPDLPFLGNDAEVPADFFDLLLESPSLRHELFSLPHEPVSPVEFALGLHASQLVRDGGTLQIGIGTLSDALVYACVLRHQRNSEYLSALKSISKETTNISSIGGTEPFQTGLYGASEMLMDGFMHLARAGILKRRVHDDPLHPRGFYLHAAFFLGSKALYEWLRSLKGDDFDGLCMTRVSRTNDLHGAAELRAGQRRDARFFNICMMATALGAAVSDALESGQVVSGVGGQYNFVAMAHALEGGRSVLMLRSTRSSGGKLHSNIVWQYGHTTIPRHLRDLVVTEYGVADLRGKSDEDTVKAMIAIADARFQNDLARAAQRAGKLAADYRIPEAARRNNSQTISAALAPFRARGLFAEFPFGSDFTVEERRLIPALQYLKARSGNAAGRLGLLCKGLLSGSPGEEIEPFLRRMGLDQPKTLAERLSRRLLARALRRTQLPL
ncbi:MAG TPA: acetyl-CoA hydrolase/transferase C-terminal domain-containing protein [Burkholderiales bacterium]|nr:acetyl-CoA hydrolase/transferase C-terminal domain-containing protein [Burkholderiales bacterium]